MNSKNKFPVRWFLGLLLSLTIFTTVSAKPEQEPPRQKPYTDLWHSRTEGNNLAKGLPVSFSHKCRGKEAPTKGQYWLTDGKLTNSLWGLDDGSISWSEPPEEGLNILLDLKSVKPIGKVVLRSLGGVGAVYSHWQFPDSFTVYISKDGDNYHRAAGYIKLNPGEKDQSDFISTYYLEQKGYGYIYPFEFNIAADARYVVVNIKTPRSFKSDELAVLEAPEKMRKIDNYNAPYETKPEPLQMEGIKIRPRFDELIISSNILTPNIMHVTDMRTGKSAKDPVTMVMELPEGVELASPKPSTSEGIEKNGKKYTRVTLPYIKKSWAYPTDAYFFSINGNIPEGATALFYGECANEKTIITEIPVKTIVIPEIQPKLTRFHISLAWMSEEDQLNYPNFFSNWEKLGFQSVSCFPRQWENFPKKGISRTTKFQKFLTEARKRGFSIIMNESPFANDMRRGYKAGDAMFSQISGKPNRDLCPSYRGKGYADEIERVETNIRATCPDYVFWDIEYWGNGTRDAELCTTCVEGAKKTGKNMDEYLKVRGTETMQDLYGAVEKASKNSTMPLVASYNHHAAFPVHHRLLDFTKVYPDYIKQAQPSLYTAGNALRVHDVVRANYRYTKRKNTIPWLSAGTYGKYEPYKLEFMIWEALLNGASGITYFCYKDFDSPLYFYHHANALALIAPYEEMIFDGELIEDTGSNQELTYSAVRKGKEMLLLIGNYKSAEEYTEYTLPCKNIKEIKNIRTGESLNPTGTLKLHVSKEDVVFLYIREE